MKKQKVWLWIVVRFAFVLLGALVLASYQSGKIAKALISARMHEK